MNYKTKQNIFSVLKYAVLSLFAVVALYPLLWLTLYSFKDNEQIFSTNPFGFPTTWHFENYVNAFHQFPLVLYFKNSIIVTVISVVIGVSIALIFAYAIARMKFKGSSFLRIFLIVGMFLPVQSYVIPLILQVKRLGLQDSLFAVILPYVGMGAPFSVLVLFGGFRSLPKELEESACIDGASIYSCFNKIILPLMSPTIAALIIYKAMNSWNEYGLAFLILRNPKLKTLPLGLASFVGEISTNWGAIGATLVIASLPILILYLCFSGSIESAMSINSGTKG
jgi:raffinose/stachyose/melibiose transport system permease protein